MSEITRGVIGMPFELAMSSHLSRMQFHSIARGLLAENEKLFKLLERTVEQYVPLTELEGVPGWSRVVALVEVVAERDQLKAESEALRQSLKDVRDSVEREYWSEYAGLGETREILDKALGKQVAQ